MIAQGQVLNRDNLNRAFVSKTATGTQILLGSLNLSGNITAVSFIGAFSGNGSLITDLNGTNISSGTVADTRLSSNVLLLDAKQTLTNDKTFSAAANLYFAGGTNYYINSAGTAKLNGLTADHTTITNQLIVNGLGIRSSSLDVTGNVVIDGTLGVVGSITGNVIGNLTGNASTATTLQIPRTINGVSFDGSSNITINTVGDLTSGAYLIGNNFNGSVATTWAVDATTTATASKVVARDAAGAIFSTSAQIPTLLSIKNVPAISNASYTTGQIELRTTDSSNPGIGFHRAGATATYLYHKGYGNEDQLRIRGADGRDGKVLYDGGVIDLSINALNRFVVPVGIDKYAT